MGATEKSVPKNLDMNESPAKFNSPISHPCHVLVFHNDETKATLLSSQFMANQMIAVVCDDATMALAVVYNDPPDVIIVHQNIQPGGGVALSRMLKADNVFAHLPILLIVPKEELKAVLSSDEFPFDDYIEDGADWDDIFARAQLCIQRAYRQLDANPLTRLPGNNSIIKELETRLARKEEMAAVYVDLDNFKAFNDRYGFARGDQALKLAARLMVNCVSSGSPKDYYVGHVGGDDFMFMIPTTRAEIVCEQFIANFDGIIGSLYDDEDRHNGCIHSVNRAGIAETFPLMTISLAVVANREGHYTHPGEISSVAAELKKQLKKNPCSCYLMDRRAQLRKADPAR